MKSGFISLIFFCIVVQLQAQNLNYPRDVVVLKNGDRITCRIIEYVQGDKLTIKKMDGTELTISDGEIKQILQEFDKTNKTGKADFKTTQGYKPKAIIKPQSKGFYNISQLSFAMGSNDEQGLALGAGVSTIFGRQFSPLFGVGLGFGLDNYARRGETIYPVFIDLRSYLPVGKKSNAYFATLNGGYGFAFKRESIRIKEAEGGIMAHAAIGYRTTTKEGVDISLDAGIKLQEAYFARNLFNGDIEVRQLTFKRFTVRMGIIFWRKNKKKR